MTRTPIWSASSTRLDSCAPDEDLTLSALTEGTHTFEVVATDALGNASSDQVTWPFVDTIAPTVTITSGPDGEIIDDAAFEFTADEPVDFECRLDSTVGGSRSGNPAVPRFSSVEYEDLAVDDYVFTAGTDSAGLQRWDLTSSPFDPR
ncbi:MAG: hypothetical protein M9922_04210 [Microthrixaceae bacterium]|nr:hypothetical protein [Microthrixaceae bacterium]